MNRIDRDGQSALFHAACGSDKTLVAQLIKAGSVLNNREHRWGATALLLAVQRSHISVVEELAAQPGIELDKAAVVEVLLQHGTQLVDSISLPMAPTESSIAIADLMAEHKGTAVKRAQGICARIAPPARIPRQPDHVASSTSGLPKQ